MLSERKVKALNEVGQRRLIEEGNVSCYYFK